jgi:hypothetical protein
VQCNINTLTRAGWILVDTSGPGTLVIFCSFDPVGAFLRPKRLIMHCAKTGGVNHFPRQNYTVLVSDAVDGRPSSWAPLAGAAPLWAGAAEYSSLLAGDGDGTMWVLYERSESLSGQDGTEVLRLTQVRLSP